MNPRQMVTFAAAILNAILKDYEPRITNGNYNTTDIQYAIALALTSIADNYDRWINKT